MTVLHHDDNQCWPLQESAERELAKLKRMLEETRVDWQKKLRERRREVRGAGSLFVRGADGTQLRQQLPARLCGGWTSLGLMARAHHVSSASA